jgi:hypothetical protein
MTFQQECRKSSLEELRVFDYNQGTNRKTASDPSAPVMRAAQDPLSTGTSGHGRSRMQLYVTRFAIVVQPNIVQA